MPSSSHYSRLCGPINCIPGFLLSALLSVTALLGDHDCIHQSSITSRSHAIPHDFAGRSTAYLVSCYLRSSASPRCLGTTTVYINHPLHPALGLTKSLTTLWADQPHTWFLAICASWRRHVAWDHNCIHQSSMMSRPRAHTFTTSRTDQLHTWFLAIRSLQRRRIAWGPRLYTSIIHHISLSGSCNSSRLCQPNEPHAWFLAICAPRYGS